MIMWKKSIIVCTYKNHNTNFSSLIFSILNSTLIINTNFSFLNYEKNFVEMWVPNFHHPDVIQLSLEVNWRFNFVLTANSTVEVPQLGYTKTSLIILFPKLLSVQI